MSERRPVAAATTAAVARERAARRRSWPPPRRRSGRAPWRSFVLLLLLLPLVFAPSARALDPAKPTSQYSLDVWQDQLPQYTVQSVVQDAIGYLWVATYEGLVRFDGLRFTVFDRRNTPEIRSNSFIELLADRGGAVWAGTLGGGLVRYENTVFTRFSVEDGLPSDFVYSLYQDPNGRVWVGTDKGLCYYDGARFVALEGEVASARVNALRTDRAGKLWIGTEGSGVYRYDGATFEYVRLEGLRDSTRVYDLTEDGQGAMWVATYGSGLYRVEPSGAQRSFTKKDGLTSDLTYSLAEDANGNLWIGTDGAGLNRFRDGRFEAFTSAQWLSHDFVRSLCEDREGSLWIGTNGGLNRLRDSKFTVFATKNGLSNDNVRTIYEDAAGAMWIGTDGGGVNCLRDGKVTVFSTKNGLSNDAVKAVYGDRTGAIWVGTTGGGLNRIVNDRVTVFTTNEGLSNNTINSLFEDSRGALWIGTYGGGVNRLENGTFTTYTTAQGLSHNIVRAIAEDRDGAIWIGTTGGGVSRFKDGAFTSLTTKDGLSNDVVFAVRPDSDGTLWIGTSGGLNRYRDGKITTYGSAQGLFDDTVFQILDDDAGTLWMSCNRGVFRVRKAELEAFDRGEVGRVTSLSYGKADGMGANQCNGASQPSGWRARDGRLWFPTVRGAAVVDPYEVRANPLPPPLAVERVVVDGEEMPVWRAGDFAPGADKLEFHYAALSLLVPERVRCKYILEGYDRDWVDAGERRAAYYTNIPPGNYRFRVIASNDDGVWNEVGAAYGFRLETPLWRTWGAIVLYALLLAGLVYGGVQARVRALRRHNVELEERVAERTVELDRTNVALAEKVEQVEQSEQRAVEASRAKSAFLAAMSHELRTPLNAIMGFVQLMGRDKGRSASDAENLSIVLRSGEHLLALINDVLSLSKIEAGRLTLNEKSFDPRLLVVELERMFAVRAEAKRLDLRFEVDPSVPEWVRGDEAKLRQILVNLLGNAIKFTSRGGVRMRARWADRRGHFAVEDTGFGIAAEEIGALFEPFAQAEAGRNASEGTGLGLAISRRFARLMGGDIEVESRLGEGTTFRFDVPLARGAAEEAQSTRAVVGLAPGQGAVRVLVVDDRWENRMLIERLFTAVGLEVRGAADGREAVEAWSAWRPRVTLMDMRLPVLDGYGATREIRSIERERGTDGDGARSAIIALSASVFEHDRDAILAAGCDDFVAKPFLEHVLFEKIAAHAGVEFVYQEEAEAPGALAGGSADGSPAADLDDAEIADRLHRIGREELSRLADALVAGDVRSAKAETDKLGESDPSLAAALAAMLKAYRVDDVLRLIESA